MWQGVPKRRHIKFSRRGITQKKAYNNTSICLRCTMFGKGARSPIPKKPFACLPLRVTVLSVFVFKTVVVTGDPWYVLRVFCCVCSFRLSFKRKEHAAYRNDRREHRDSLSAAVPAKFIRATTVKPQTLNPRWNEKFRLWVNTSTLSHVDILVTKFWRPSRPLKTLSYIWRS